MRTFILALALVAAPALGAAPESGARSAKVLDLLREVVHSPPRTYFNPRDLAPFLRIEVPELGEKTLAPRMAPGCGMVTLESLPVDRARDGARLLFLAYGLSPREGYEVRTGSIRGRLDLYDEEAKVGFEIVSGIDSPNLPTRGSPETEPEPPDSGLSPEEIRALRDRGRKIHAVPLGHLVGRPQDDLSPLLACLAGTVEFLNSATDGEDVDLGGLLTGKEARRKVDAVAGSAVPPGKDLPGEDGNSFFVAKGAGSVRLEFGVGKAGGGGGPCLVAIPFTWQHVGNRGSDDPADPIRRFTLVQRGPDGVLRIESRRAVFLAPAGFDPSKPFAVEVEIPAGQVHTGQEAMLLVP